MPSILALHCPICKLAVFDSSFFDDKASIIKQGLPATGTGKTIK
jgi:hypothetical protein